MDIRRRRSLFRPLLCIGPLQASELNASGRVDALHTRPHTSSDFARCRFHIAESCHERLLCGTVILVVRLDVLVLIRASG